MNSEGISGNDTDPLISVMIPCFNYGRYLKESIVSVLDQTYSNTEIIVVDDGSTDNTSSVASAFGSRVNYVFQKHQGIASARNTGIENATGSFFSFLDSDDQWSNNKLRLQLDYFQSNSDVDIVYGLAKQYYSPEVPDEFKKSKGFRQEILKATITAVMLISRDQFMSVGSFTSLKVGIDQEWYMRAMDLGLRMHTIDEIIYFRRIHENNNGIVVDPVEQITRLRVIKQSLDRRRLRK